MIRAKVAVPSLVIPSQIPWDRITAEHLEEFAYWILDALGARDLQWRAGSVGRGAADGGRDLEATFFRHTPDGEFISERWWVECKGRTDTVDRRVVQDIVADAEVEPGLDLVVIVTNSRFTNPAHDWIRQRREARKLPPVRLWDREQLERLAVKHPEVLARVAPEALSAQGQVEAVAAEFLNLAHLPNGLGLQRLWSAKDELEWRADSLCAVVVGEIVNGDVGQRPWAAWAPKDPLLDAIEWFLENMPALAYRRNRFGANADLCLQAVQYMFAAALIRTDEDTMKGLLMSPWRQRVDEAEIVERLAEFFIDPMLARMRAEFGDVCSRDCRRVSTELSVLSEDAATSRYWDRFILEPDTLAHETDERPQVVIELNDPPCRVDVVTPETGCPLYRFSIDPRQLLDGIGRAGRERVQLRRQERQAERRPRPTAETKPAADS